MSASLHNPFEQSRDRAAAGESYTVRVPGSRLEAPVALLGLGAAAPASTLDQQAAADFAARRCCETDRQRAWLNRIYRQSGVRRRASVLLEQGDGTAPLAAFYPPGGPSPTTAARMQRYADTAGSLAARACRAAFSDAAAIEPAAITHLVTVSCTGLMSPGLDAELIDRLGLSADVGRLNLGFMGCHGALNGLQAAGALVQSGGRVLLCCVELCSLHFQYGWDPQNIVANALFADGAGAAILAPAGGGSAWRLAATASRVAPDSGDAMSWRIGDHGFEMTLSRKVPELIRGALGDWIADWLAQHRLRIGDVAHWAIHPGGPRIIETALESLSLPDAAGETSRAVLAEHGNMSSPTALFILHRLRARSAARPCVAMGFGPGLALEAALFV